MKYIYDITAMNLLTENNVKSINFDGFLCWKAYGSPELQI